MATPADILAHLAGVIVATGEGLPSSQRLRLSTRRQPIERETAQSVHRNFDALWTGGRGGRQHFGDGQSIYELDLAIRVAYWQGGGDAGGGDRLSILELAGTDAALIADALTQTVNYWPPDLGIREVTFMGGGEAGGVDKVVVWQSTYRVEVSIASPL